MRFSDRRFRAASVIARSLMREKPAVFFARSTPPKRKLRPQGRLGISFARFAPVI